MNIVYCENNFSTIILYRSYVVQKFSIFKMMPMTNYKTCSELAVNLSFFLTRYFLKATLVCKKVVS